MAPATDLTGILVLEIPAGAAPDPVALAPFFKGQVGSMLSKVPVPTRPSKYARWVVQLRPGRCFVFPNNPKAFKIEPGDTRLLSPCNK